MDGRHMWRAKAPAGVGRDAHFGRACTSFPALPKGLTSPSPGCSLFPPAGPASNCPSAPDLLGENRYQPLDVNHHTHTYTQGEHTACELKEWGNGLLWVVAKTTQKNCSHNFQALNISMWWWWEIQKISFFYNWCEYTNVKMNSVLLKYA